MVPFADRIKPLLKQAVHLYHRLILLVAPAGAGKTDGLQIIHDRSGIPIFNINLELSRRMLDLTERQRSLKMPFILDDIVGNCVSEVILLDNIEVLFDVSLKQDPLRLLQGISRNKTLVVAWTGYVKNENVFYATPDHPEYQRYPIRDFLVVTP